MTSLMRWLTGIALLTFSLGGGCTTSTPPVETSSGELRTDFEDLFSVLDAGDLDRWVAVRSKLRDGVTDATAVQVVCSASRRTRHIGQCAWVLGVSRDALDGTTGAHRGEVGAVVCPVPAPLTVKSFLDQLSAAGDGALRSPVLPDGSSFADALAKCLASATLPPPVTSTPGDFVTLSMKTDWSEIEHRLSRAFDDVCGDTFCEGDYGDIGALHLTCAEDLRSGEVASCTWTFALAQADVAADGTISATTTTSTCSIPIAAPAGALVGVLAGDDPLQVPLPGKTTSLYDALRTCL